MTVHATSRVDDRRHDFVMDNLLLQAIVLFNDCNVRGISEIDMQIFN